MNLVAEHGIAAHWKYKEGKPVARSSDDKKFAWLRQLMECAEGAARSDRVPRVGQDRPVRRRGLRVHAAGRRQGAAQGLAARSTSRTRSTRSIGDHCSGARVNGMIVPLRYQLRNGDTIEIITSPNQKPNKDWLKLVKTARARTKIRYLLRQEQRDKAVALGTDLLDKALRKHDTTLAARREAARGTRRRSCAASDRRRADRPGRLRQDHRRSRCSRRRCPTLAKKGEARPPPKTESMLKTLLRKVTRRTSSQRHQGRRRGRHPRAVREVLLAAAGRSDRRLHHARPRRHRAPPRLRQGPRSRSRAPHRRRVGRPRARRSTRSRSRCCAPTSRACSRTSRSRSPIRASTSAQAHCRATEDGRAVNTFHASVRDLDQLKSVIRSLSRIKGVFSRRSRLRRSGLVAARALALAAGREVTSAISPAMSPSRDRSRPHHHEHVGSVARHERLHGDELPMRSSIVSALPHHTRRSVTTPPTRAVNASPRARQRPSSSRQVQRGNRCSACSEREPAAQAARPAHASACRLADVDRPRDERDGREAAVDGADATRRKS